MLLAFRPRASQGRRSLSLDPSSKKIYCLWIVKPFTNIGITFSTIERRLIIPSAFWVSLGLEVLPGSLNRTDQFLTSGRPRGRFQWRKQTTNLKILNRS